MRLLKSDDTSQKLHCLVSSRAKTRESQNSYTELFRYDLTLFTAMFPVIYFSASFVIFQGERCVKKPVGCFVAVISYIRFETWSCHVIFVHISHPTESDDLHL